MRGAPSTFSILTGGGISPLGPTFFEPTVVADVPADALLTREETFGPLAVLIPFEEEVDAVRMANDTPYGLAAYLFTRTTARARRVAAGIEAGMVGVNTGLISSEVAPFGGVKMSGLGREGSKYGLAEYLDVKYVCLDD